jgi:hypothetical protein
MRSGTFFEGPRPVCNFPIQLKLKKLFNRPPNYLEDDFLRTLFNSIGLDQTAKSIKTLTVSVLVWDEPPY